MSDGESSLIDYAPKISRFLGLLISCSAFTIDTLIGCILGTFLKFNVRLHQSINERADQALISISTILKFLALVNLNLKPMCSIFVQG